MSDAVAAQVCVQCTGVDLVVTDRKSTMPGQAGGLEPARIARRASERRVMYTCLTSRICVLYVPVQGAAMLSWCASRSFAFLPWGLSRFLPKLEHNLSQ